MSDERQSSMLYSMLPSAVQNRLPRLPSLRRSVSAYGATGKGKSKSAPNSPPKTRPGTPDETEAYGAVVLRESTTAALALERSSETERRRALEVTEQSSGIGWKFAGQGLSLLTLSLDEASTATSSIPAENSSFARHLYVHAITYLLRGLPHDLSAEETLSVRSSLPRALAQPIHITASPSNAQTQERRPPHPPSLLHRTLSSSIIHFFVLVSLLLPYLKIMLRRMHEYERQHHVTERFLQSGVGAVDEIGKRGFGIGAVVWGAGIGDLMGWFLEEVGAGVREGVEGGLMKVSGAGSSNAATSLGVGKW